MKNIFTHWRKSSCGLKAEDYKNLYFLMKQRIAHHFSLNGNENEEPFKAIFMYYLVK